MRPALHGDVSAAARALLAVPRGARVQLCRGLIRRAERADRYRLATGRCHPRWGNGSLMAAARTQALADEPGFDDIDYCRCFRMVLAALVVFRITRQRS